MASSSSLPSQFLSSSSMPQWTATATGESNTNVSRQLSDIFKTSEDYNSHVFTSENNQASTSMTFQKISTTSVVDDCPVMLKLSLQRKKNKTDDQVVPENDEESTEYETEKVDNSRKRALPEFPASLGREKIEDDLLAMSSWSKRSKRSALEEKTTINFENKSFQDDSTGSRYNNLWVENSENASTSSEGRRKMLLRFITTASNKKNDDMVDTSNIAVDQNQTLISAESEEREKVKTCKNKGKVSAAVNKTLVAAEPESTQLGIVPLMKQSGVKKKQTFSKLSVSLPREDIEADLIAMGGLQRSRRIKKRPKNVQRQLDNLFPGLRLKYITPEDYKVRE
ncbi:DUF1639 family protein [Melia azedarach]|uniref:DUF1639 family protein n=1 Tax=Melia azedarach TaxID=155640 RepID=A0ACC1Y6Z7_MELAZ|nr:DUF1639 family protein [Melia azedarach]